MIRSFLNLSLLSSINVTMFPSTISFDRNGITSLYLYSEPLIISIYDLYEMNTLVGTAFITLQVIYVILNSYIGPDFSGCKQSMQGSAALKRKRPDGTSLSESLTDAERVLYNVIRSKKDMAIWSQDMKKETNLPDNVVRKALTSLQAKNLIKEVVNRHNKAKKHYMASEFEPSKEITGGDWYSNGNLDKEFIEIVKNVCLKHIFTQKVATLDGILDWLKRSKIFSVEFSSNQIEEILRALVLDDKIIEMKSTGFDDFASIPVGRVCYRCKSKSGSKGEPKIGSMASIPCGVCPRISYCTPDGIISPRTCEYYQKWLDF